MKQHWLCPGALCCRMLIIYHNIRHSGPRIKKKQKLVSVDILYSVHDLSLFVDYAYKF